MSDPEDPEIDNEPVKDLPGFAGFVALGSTIATCVAGGVVAGIAADRAWNLQPWGLLSGLVLGAALAVASVLQLVRKWL